GRAAGAEESISADLSWQNYLSRAYDAIAIRASGRQRIMSHVGDDPGVLLYPFEVDATTDELVISVAWQNPNTTQFIRLIDPNGVTLPLAPHQTIVPGLTGEVWR